MARSVGGRLDGLQAKGHAARFAPATLRGEGVRKGVATDDGRALGKVCRRVREILGFSPDDMATALGYAGTSEVSRNEAGIINATYITRLLTRVRTRPAAVEALAEQPGDNVTLRKVVTIGPAPEEVAS
jgi:hypothetical protein